MNRQFITVAWIAVAAATAAAAHATSAPTLIRSSQIAIDGQSSIRSFTCTARTIRAQVGGDAAAGAPMAERLKSLATNAQLEIDPKQLDCGDATMNDHMFKALKTDQHG